MRGAAALLLLLAGLVSPAALHAQPTNHIGQMTAGIMVTAGCVMSEAEIVEALKAQGFGISDFQAQVTALHRGGYLAAAGENRLRLVNWGKCT